MKIYHNIGIITAKKPQVNTHDLRILRYFGRISDLYIKNSEVTIEETESSPMTTRKTMSQLVPPIRARF